jgi:hypothetical protein
VENWAKKSGITDTNLRNFNDYGINYIKNKSNNLVNEYLAKDDRYTEEEKMLMAEVIRSLNVKYFDGTAHHVKEEIVNPKGYKLWRTFEPSFMLVW